ncbi:MAG TPA: hypothetical protein VMV56_07635 [Williamwhitmania sp.]|nr:hypothetical protein [Williamwhitmania sp.]
MKASSILFFVFLFIFGNLYSQTDSTKVDIRKYQEDQTRLKYSQSVMINLYLQQTGKSVEDAFTDLLIQNQNLSSRNGQLSKRLDKQIIQLTDSLMIDLKSLESAKVDSIITKYTQEEDTK